jgi:hypothetical protein
MLLNFDPSTVSSSVLNKLNERLHLSRPDVLTESIRKVSKAAAVIYQWIRSVYKICLLTQQLKRVG